MTEIISKLKPLITHHSPLLAIRLPTVRSQRQYAKPHGRYIDYRANPLYRKEDQAQLESEELTKMSVLPVQPPGPHESCSIYHDPLVNKMIQHVMEMGKKQLARSLVEKGFENIKRTQIERYHLAATPEERASIELDPKVILRRAVENCKPLLMMSPVRRGGITYQVPGPITDKRSLFLAIKWLLEATNEKERTVHFPEKFAWELLDAANNTGAAVKRKQDLHRQCEANRAYAHYRW